MGEEEGHGNLRSCTSVEEVFGGEEVFVARGFIPDGLRSSPCFFWIRAGSLRNPSGINPLATIFGVARAWTQFK
jgi:hypothetical protein